MVTTVLHRLNLQRSQIHVLNAVMIEHRMLCIVFHLFEVSYIYFTSLHGCHFAFYLIASRLWFVIRIWYSRHVYFWSHWTVRLEITTSYHTYFKWNQINCDFLVATYYKRCLQFAACLIQAHGITWHPVLWHRHHTQTHRLINTSPSSEVLSCENERCAG